ncbi:hypothetical protein [Halostella salina]|uniref:hypothetical protein n=1 Tax=Halostella salina TaxID=1547897 RepID=UPI000EF7D42E|nr:hypothetical protein [Halostella salina]
MALLAAGSVAAATSCPAALLVGRGVPLPSVLLSLLPARRSTVSAAGVSTLATLLAVPSLSVPLPLLLTSLLASLLPGLPGLLGALVAVLLALAAPAALLAASRPVLLCLSLLVLLCLPALGSLLPPVPLLLSPVFLLVLLSVLPLVLPARLPLTGPSLAGFRSVRSSLASAVVSRHCSPGQRRGPGLTAPVVRAVSRESAVVADGKPGQAAGKWLRGRP